MMRLSIAVALLGAACGNKTEGSATKASPSAPAPAKDTTKVDPYWVRVDADQLIAACAQSILPPATFRPDAAVLTTSDGRRIPWLTMRVAAQADGPDLPIDDWIARATTAAKREAERETVHRPPNHRPDTWLNVPCTGSEILDTVVTVVLSDDKGDRVFAMHGAKSLDEALPAKTDGAELTKRACALTEKLLGTDVTIAKHVLAETGNALSTVNDPAWSDACFAGSP